MTPALLESLPAPRARSGRRGALITVLVALTAGCGADVHEVDAGPDAGTPRVDAGRPDAGGPIDAGAIDATTPSDAGPPEPCDDPGAAEDVACGNCGTTQRFCTAERVWAYGACTDEGECAPGATRSDGACGSCGVQPEQCSDACAWVATGECVEAPRACVPGTRTRNGDGCPSGQNRDVVCGDACTFEPESECEDDSCPTPGVAEDVPCGNCGTVERFCTSARVWSYSTCGDEGECAPGTLEQEACGACGMAPRRCTAACVFEVGACEDEGECTPGSMSRTTEGCGPDESRALTCNASCEYEPGACELDECTPGATMDVACGMCGTRRRTCSDARRWVDGSCTGEGECMPGTTGTEACGRCGERVTLCDVACTWQPSGSCTGQGSCAPGATSACSTSCGSTGTSVCTDACTPGACAAPAEVCNGEDDDCDVDVDEGCVGCGPCAGSTPVTGTGGTYLVPLLPNARSGSCGGAGREALLSLSLTETSDVFVSTHGATIDTVLYVRNCTCTGSELGCSDDTDGRTTSSLRLTSLPAGEYTLVVDSETTTATSVPVHVYVTPAGVRGDRCGNPRVLAPGGPSVSGTTCGLTDDYDILTDGAGCIFSAGGNAQDAVYAFFVPTTRTVTVSACGAGNTYDTTLYIRSACNGATIAEQVACDDDGCDSGATCDGFRSSLSATLTPGLYFLIVDGYRTDPPSTTCVWCGDFELALTGI